MFSLILNPYSFWRENDYEDIFQVQKVGGDNFAKVEDKVWAHERLNSFYHHLYLCKVSLII